MTASIELTDKELAEVKELTQQEETSAALRQAMSEYIRYAKRMRLKELSNELSMEDNWRELEKRELNS